MGTQQKPPQQPIAGRTTRSSTRTTRKLLDRTTLASKSVLTMSQNELLDCILTRLEDLESSQTRTSLRVRVLTQRLMRQKQKQKQNTISSCGLSRSRPRPPPAMPVHASIKTQSPEIENDIRMVDGEGESEATLLASMREGTSISLPCQDFSSAI